MRSVGVRLIVGCVLSVAFALESVQVGPRQADISAFFSSGHVPPAPVEPVAEQLHQAPPEPIAAPKPSESETAEQKPSHAAEPPSNRLARESLDHQIAGHQIGHDAGGYFVYHRSDQQDDEQSPESTPASTVPVSDGWVQIGALPAAGKHRGCLPALMSCCAGTPHSGRHMLGSDSTTRTLLSGWFNSSGYRCHFGTVSSEHAIHVINSTHMTCITPPHSVGNHTIYLAVTSTSSLLLATEVTFEYHPSMFVADRANNRVLRFNANTGGFVDTYIQANAGGLDRPCGIAFGPDRNFFVSSERTSSVLKYHGSTGRFQRKFCHVHGQPRGLVFHLLNMYVASAFNDAVYAYNANTGSAKGVYIGSSSGLKAPWGLVFDAYTNKTFVSSSQTNLIHLYGPARGQSIDGKGMTELNGMGNAQVPNVQGLELTADSLYAVGPHPGKTFVRFNRSTGMFMHHFEDDDLTNPTDIKEFKDYVYITTNHQVRKYNRLNGEFVRVHATHQQLVSSALLFHHKWDDYNKGR